MEKKLVILDKNELTSISGKVFGLLEMLKFVAESTEDTRYGNIIFHWVDCLASILTELDALSDNSPTTTNEATLYLWRRMLKTGKTQFTRTDINKLITHSKHLPDMEAAEQALNMLKTMGRICETRISQHNHAKSIYTIVMP